MSRAPVASRKRRTGKPWCAARHASGRRCNTIVAKNGRLCGFHKRLVDAFESEAERLRQIEGQAELKEFIKAYRHRNGLVGNIAKRVLDEGREITPVMAARLGKIAAKEAFELTPEYRMGQLPEHLRTPSSGPGP